MRCEGAGLVGALIGEERDGFLAHVEKTQRTPETCSLPLSMNPSDWGISHRKTGREGQGLAHGHTAGHTAGPSCVC